MEITDEAAKAALRIYVHHTGKPHDGMRAAILSVLPTEPERVADRYTPTAVTDEAVRAALNANVSGDRPLGGYTNWAVAEMRDQLTAALPHLTLPVKDGLDGEYWTERIDMLANAVDKLTEAVEARRWAVREPAEEVDEEAIFERGREVGRSEAAAYEGILEVASPSDYEVWRDAWTLAVGDSERDARPDELRDKAEWFLERLKAGPPGPPVPKCEHCGADSSMDHDGDCPNAPDPDNEPMDYPTCEAPPDAQPCCTDTRPARPVELNPGVDLGPLLPKQGAETAADKYDRDESPYEP